MKPSLPHQCYISVYLTLALLVPMRLPAHDTWLVPKRWVFTTATSFTLQLTSGMIFPTLDHAVQSERIKQSFVRISGQRLILLNMRSAPKALEISGGVAGSGIAACWIELHPKTLELKPNLIREYLEEIGASDSLKAAWKLATKTQRWRERYTKHAKTFAALGTSEQEALNAARQDTTWNTPVGLGLEIVPEKNPFSVKAGDTLPVRVLKDGKPLAGFMLGLSREGQKRSTFQRTDAEGRATFTLGKAGQYLFRGTELRFVSQPELEVESDFTTLTFNVFKPAR